MATEPRPLITKPLSNTEALAMCDADKFITLRVAVPFNDLMCDDIDDLNDSILKHAFENDYLPEEISYNPVGVAAPKNGGTVNDVIVEVTCNLQSMANEEDEESES